MLMNGWKSIRQWFWYEHQSARRMIYNVHCLWYFILLWNVVVWEILHQKLTYPIPLIWNTPQTPGLVFDQIISAVHKVDMFFCVQVDDAIWLQGRFFAMFRDVFPITAVTNWIFHLQKASHFLAICRPLSLEIWWMATQRPQRWIWGNLITTEPCDRALEIIVSKREIIPKWPQDSG